MHNKLDHYYPLLKNNPGRHPQEKPEMFINGIKSNYPIPWTDILGNIFHPLYLKYSNNIKQAVPACNFTNYR